MAVRREQFGETLTGAPIYEYHISNASGVEAVVLNYGATIKNIFVPDKEGKRVDVALGYDDYKKYFDNDCFLGATVGPTANRIAKARYAIDGKEFILPINDGPNNLHTDMNNGFHKRIWDASEGEDSVTFTLKAEDGDLGFSGNRVFELTYTVTEDNELKLHYHATSDAKTLMNLTNHVYFNLGGHNSGSILDHTMQMNASKYTPVSSSEAIPTGEIADVAGTAFDFRTAKTLGQDVNADEEQLKFVGGYDHNYVVDGYDWKTMKNFCTVSSPKTGIKMECFTNLPGFQLYVGNFLNAQGAKDGATYKARDGFCLETQVYPNSINEAGFPDCVYGPDREYDNTTVYKFSK